MPDRLYRSAPTKPKQPVKGHGENLDIRIDTKRYPEIMELLKTRTKEDFERIYKIKFSDEEIPEGKSEIPWKGFKNRLVAILGHIARRKDQQCDDSSLH